MGVKGQRWRPNFWSQWRSEVRDQEAKQGSSRWQYLLPPVLRAQKGLIAAPQEPSQLQLLADPLLRTEEASADPSPPHPLLPHTPASHPCQLSQASWPHSCNRLLVRVRGVGGQRGPVTVAEHLGMGPGQGWLGRGERPGQGRGQPHHSHKHQGSFGQGLGLQQRQEQEKSSGEAPKPCPSHLRTAQTLSSAHRLRRSPTCSLPLPQHPPESRSLHVSPRSRSGLLGSGSPGAFASLGFASGSTCLIFTVTLAGADSVLTIPIVQVGKPRHSRVSNLPEGTQAVCGKTGI